MTKKYQLIGVGSPIVDTLAQVSEAFVAGIDGAKGGMELVNSEQMAGLLKALERAGGTSAQAPGGSAGNTVATAATLGLRCSFVGKLGNDAGAQAYREAFAAEGIDVTRFKQAALPNARCLSLITPDGERTMRTDLGAALTLGADEISAADFADAAHAHIEGYLLFNRELALRVLAAAREAGCTISLDLASFEVVGAAADILPGLLKDYVDIVFANEDEARAFTGLNNEFETMVEQLASQCKVAVVKLGKDGSLIRSAGQTHRIRPQYVERPLDTTGAGDLWAAGFLYGYLNGRDLETCGDYGSRLGAEVVQVLGATLPAERWRALELQGVFKG